MSVQIERYKRYRGRFMPRRTDDLRPGCAAMIGTLVEVDTGWQIEADQVYAGHWAMRCPIGWPAAWIPSCDLTELEELP